MYNFIILFLPYFILLQASDFEYPDKFDKSDSDTSTDIDAIVDEYRQKIKVKLIEISVQSYQISTSLPPSLGHHSWPLGAQCTCAHCELMACNDILHYRHRIGHCPVRGWFGAALGSSCVHWRHWCAHRGPDDGHHTPVHGQRHQCESRALRPLPATQRGALLRLCRTLLARCTRLATGWTHSIAAM